MYKKHDLLIYAFILLFAGITALVWTFSHADPGGHVRVSIDGVTAGEYSLSEDLKTEIPGFAGGHLTLVIFEGKADVTYSSCPDLICVRHAPIWRTGESIICLPNRIVIEVLQDSDNELPDIDALAR